MEAEAWLAVSGDKEPQPTDLMRRFLLASRQGATKRQRFILGAVSLALVVAVSLALVGGRPSGPHRPFPPTGRPEPKAPG